jgi:parallel beta-helix repeat protein
MISHRSLGIFVLYLCCASFAGANLWHPDAAAKAGQDLDRYVSTTGKDSNPGSMRLPWATIQNAANHAQPGMTIHVAPGTYRLSAVIASRTSGTSSGRIRYVSDEKWGAKIVSSADPIWDNEGAYVDVVGFDISGGGASYTGIHSQGSYDRSIGNRIHDFGSTGCMPGAGVMIGGGATNQSAIANIIYNIGPLPPAVPGCNLIHGIYVATAGCTVVNNITFNNAAKGIQLWGTPADCVVANNTSFHNQDGMVLGNDGAGSSSLDNSIIANNIAYNNVRYGLYESGSVGPHNQYLNNLISSNCTDPKACDDPRTQVHMIAGHLTNTVIADPQFVNYTGGENGDYHLAAGSPAIHRGTTMGAPMTDFDGNRRAPVPDIGACQSKLASISARTPDVR